jgi:hypothetical protein
MPTNRPAQFAAGQDATAAAVSAPSIAPCNPRDPPSFSAAYLEPLPSAQTQASGPQPRDHAKSACRARLHPWFGVPSIRNRLTNNDLLTDQRTSLRMALHRANPYPWFGVPFCRGRTEPVSVVWGSLSPALLRNPRLPCIRGLGFPFRQQADTARFPCNRGLGFPHPWFGVPFHPCIRGLGFPLRPGIRGLGFPFRGVSVVWGPLVPMQPIDNSATRSCGTAPLLLLFSCTLTY